jgi:hypothetical protein
MGDGGGVGSALECREPAEKVRRWELSIAASCTRGLIGLDVPVDAGSLINS